MFTGRVPVTRVVYTELISQNTCTGNGVKIIQKPHRNAGLMVAYSLLPDEIRFRVLFDNLFIPHERSILLVFCYPTVVGGRRPLPPKMGDQ